MGQYRKYLLILLCAFSSISRAQQFSVHSFRQLSNDITAYIESVKDLNEEACALVKVVCPADYAFSSPLGIVQRRNEVGEVWLFLPHGSLLLTLKHPQWGVLRDYRFTRPLESRMTYELVINSPIVVQTPQMPAFKKASTLWDTLRHCPPATLPQKPMHLHRPQLSLRRIVTAHLAFAAAQPALGVRFGVVRRHGIYVSAQSDFQSQPNTVGSCRNDGSLIGSEARPYYNGRTQESNLLVVAGGMHRLWQRLYLYEGVGYGSRQVLWQTSEAQWVKQATLSKKGIGGEAGLLYLFNRWVVSAGIQTYCAKQWQSSLGIGFHF